MSFDFFARGLHTRTALAHLPLRQAFLFSLLRTTLFKNNFTYILKVSTVESIYRILCCTTSRGRRVRQGCSLSPMLFVIYDEAMVKEATANDELGVKVGGQVISMIRSINQSINQSNLVFVKRHLNKVLRGASYE